MQDQLKTPEALYKALDTLKAFATEDGREGLNVLGALVAMEPTDFFLASLTRRRDMWEQAWFDLHPEMTADNFARASRQVYPVIDATFTSGDPEGEVPAMLSGGEPRWDDAQAVEALIQDLDRWAANRERKQLDSQPLHRAASFLAELRVLYVYGARIEENPAFFSTARSICQAHNVHDNEWEVIYDDGSTGRLTSDDEDLQAYLVESEEVWIGLPEEKKEHDKPVVYTVSFGVGEGADPVSTRMEAAQFFANEGFDGNVVTGIGFTKKWGTERSVTITTATREVERLWSSIWHYLRTHDQECAYVQEGTRPYLVWADGRVTDLS